MRFLFVVLSLVTGYMPESVLAGRSDCKRLIVIDNTQRLPSVVVRISTPTGNCLVFQRSRRCRHLVMSVFSILAFLANE